jgi:hypothetical protein
MNGVNITEAGRDINALAIGCPRPESRCANILETIQVEKDLSWDLRDILEYQPPIV